jgi:uncharacterized protein (DUF1810 family)
MPPADPFNLERFVSAQEPVFDTVLAELRAALKRSHWIWFIFPQLAALGHSPTAKFYGIASLEEARAYLAHPVLGPRLETCTGIVLTAKAASLHAIFGSPDDLKFRSCMTLFSCATGQASNQFQKGLERWCGGHPDDRTLAILKAS